MRCNGSNWAVYSPGSWDCFRNDVWALWAGVIMRLEHHLVGGYVRYISPYIIIIITCTYPAHYLLTQELCSYGRQLFLGAHFTSDVPIKVSCTQYQGDYCYNLNKYGKWKTKSWGPSKSTTWFCLILVHRACSHVNPLNSTGCFCWIQDRVWPSYGCFAFAAVPIPSKSNHWVTF